MLRFKKKFEDLESKVTNGVLAAAAALHKTQSHEALVQIAQGAIATVSSNASKLETSAA